MNQYPENLSDMLKSILMPDPLLNQGLGNAAQQWVQSSSSAVYPVQNPPKTKDRKASRLSLVKAALMSLPPIEDAHEAARQAVMRADIILAMLETEDKLKE